MRLACKFGIVMGAGQIPVETIGKRPGDVDRARP